MKFQHLQMASVFVPSFADLLNVLALVWHRSCVAAIMVELGLQSPKAGLLDSTLDSNTVYGKD